MARRPASDEGKTRRPQRPPRLWLEWVARRRRITFYVNEEPHTRWYGATVEHALIAHDQRVLKDVREGRAWVVDSRGARVGLGGTLEDGARLHVRYAVGAPRDVQESEGSD